MDDDEIPISERALVHLVWLSRLNEQLLHRLQDCSPGYARGLPDPSSRLIRAPLDDLSKLSPTVFRQLQMYERIYQTYSVRSGDE